MKKYLSTILISGAGFVIGPVGSLVTYINTPYYYWTVKETGIVITGLLICIVSGVSLVVNIVRWANGD